MGGGEMREGVGDGEDEYDHPLPLNGPAWLGCELEFNSFPSQGAGGKR